MRFHNSFGGLRWRDQGTGPRHNRCVLVFAGGTEFRIGSASQRNSVLRAPILPRQAAGELEQKWGVAARVELGFGRRWIAVGIETICGSTGGVPIANRRYGRLKTSVTEGSALEKLHF